MKYNNKIRKIITENIIIKNKNHLIIGIYVALIIFVFLGECCVDLQKALLDDNPVWYRLEDPRQLRSPRSPRSSIASDTSIRTLRRGDRSLSGMFYLQMTTSLL